MVHNNKNGVIYYNRGGKCIIRLATSLFSLRKHFHGSVRIIQHGELPESAKWFESYIKQFPNTELYHIHDDKTIRNSLEFKARLWEFTPFTNTMFMDADTLVVNKIDDFFALVEKHSLVFTDFCGWVTSGRKIQGRIQAWRKVIGHDEVAKAIAYGRAVNTGVFGFQVNDHTKKFLAEWATLATAGGKANCTPRMLDELACQVLLHKFDHHMADSKWNVSVKYGDSIKDARIIHYHGMKHVGEWAACAKWKDHYWEMRNLSPYYDNMAESNGDRRFRHYLRSVVKNDLTIVTAANAAYLPKLVKNMNQWMTIPGLREQRYIVFLKGFRPRSTDTRPIRKFKNVNVIPWELKAAEHNPREEMLSAFVFGVANHVKTKYWMKLDGDCSVKTKTFVFPSYSKETIVAHPWGYTKMKDPYAKEHWFNTLDKWWIKKYGGTPWFEPMDPVKHRKHRHSRFCSFCYIEKLSFTQELAADCENGRLPIPSQDTLTWYYARRKNVIASLINMKEQIHSH